MESHSGIGTAAGFCPYSSHAKHTSPTINWFGSGLTYFSENTTCIVVHPLLYVLYRLFGYSWQVTCGDATLPYPEAGQMSRWDFTLQLCPATVQTEVHDLIGRKCLCCEGVSTFVPGAMGMACWKAPSWMASQIFAKPWRLLSARTQSEDILIGGSEVSLVWSHRC